MKKDVCADMPLMVSDWLASTAIAMMTPAEEGAYLRLLLHAWNSPDCSLPDDDTSLAQLSRLGDLWPESAKKIRACFESEAGRIFNLKQRAIRAVQSERVEKAREQRRAAINSRWDRAKAHNSANRDVPKNGRNTAVLRTNIRGDTSVLSTLNKEREKWIAPTKEECVEAARAKGFDPKEGERFFAHYTKSGWTQIRAAEDPDWRHLLALWKPAQTTAESHLRKRTVGVIAQDKKAIESAIERLKMETEPDPETGLLVLKPSAKKTISDLRKRIEALDQELSEVAGDTR